MNIELEYICLPTKSLERLASFTASVFDWSLKPGVSHGHEGAFLYNDEDQRLGVFFYLSNLDLVNETPLYFSISSKAESLFDDFIKRYNLYQLTSSVKEDRNLEVDHQEGQIVFYDLDERPWIFLEKRKSLK